MRDGWLCGRRARSHRERHTGLRPLLMIGAVPVFRHPVFRVGRFVRGRHDPNFQGQMLQTIRLQKWIDRHGRLSRSGVGGHNRSPPLREKGALANSVVRGEPRKRRVLSSGAAGSGGLMLIVEIYLPSFAVAALSRLCAIRH